MHCVILFSFTSRKAFFTYANEHHSKAEYLNNSLIDTLFEGKSGVLYNRDQCRERNATSVILGSFFKSKVEVI